MSIEDWERSVEEMFQRMQTPEWLEAAKRAFDTDEISVPTDRVRSAHLSRKELPVDRNYSEEHQDVILRNDPEITNGRTTFKDTRVPLDSMYDYRQAGHTLTDWMAGYPSVARWRAEAVWQWPDEVIEEWIAKGEAIVRAKRATGGAETRLAELLNGVEYDKDNERLPDDFEFPDPDE